jgi:hypothetical protein
MLVPRESDGGLSGWPDPAPESCPQTNAELFWDFVQKASLLLGLVVTVRTLTK